MYIALTEGYVFLGNNDEEIHAKKYDIFKVLNEKEYKIASVIGYEYFEEGDDLYEDWLDFMKKYNKDEGETMSEYEMIDHGIVEEPITLFRDGWQGDFYEITDAWDNEEWFGEFSNGSSDDEFEELPEYKEVTIKEFDNLSRGITPVFWW